MLRNANVLHKARIYIKPNSNGTASLWVYSNYNRETLGLPSLPINSKTSLDEHALVRKADRKILVLKMLGEWVSSYVAESGKKNARQGKTGKFIVIPLSENALAIMRGLKARRELQNFQDVA